MCLSRFCCCREVGAVAVKEGFAFASEVVVAVAGDTEVGFKFWCEGSIEAVDAAHYIVATETSVLLVPSKIGDEGDIMEHVVDGQGDICPVHPLLTGYVAVAVVEHIKQSRQGLEEFIVRLVGLVYREVVVVNPFRNAYICKTVGEVCCTKVDYTVDSGLLNRIEVDAVARGPEGLAAHNAVRYPGNIGNRETEYGVGYRLDFNGCCGQWWMNQYNLGHR